MPALVTGDPAASSSTGMGIGAAARLMIRSGGWRKPTASLAPGFLQANLVVLPQAFAYDFLLFCQRNPRPCPLLDVTDVGSYIPDPTLAANADLRTDLPLYRIYRDGRLQEEIDDLTDLWQPDFVSFLLGCSFTFERALISAGIPVRHLECGSNVPMFRTNIPCRPAGAFAGPMVVSMRPIPSRLVPEAVQVTARFPDAHGAPIHIGDPSAIGIAALDRPDYGDPVAIYRDELPVFWACGVTAQAVAQSARIPYMITHAPGHMFITDRLIGRATTPAPGATERKDGDMNAVSPDFFDFVNYNFCRAISEHVGREQAVKVFERAGEIGYTTLKGQGAIRTDGQSPLDVLVQIVRFLEENGYMGRIELNRISETEMQVDMYGISVMDSSTRLTDQGYAPSHIMTNLMFAALKEFGMSVELTELEFEPEADHVREHWKLSPAA
jgi:uncharacterized protein YcsI (UPF0317 family)